MGTQRDRLGREWHVTDGQASAGAEATPNPVLFLAVAVVMVVLAAAAIAGLIRLPWQEAAPPLPTLSVVATGSPTATSSPTATNTPTASPTPTMLPTATPEPACQTRPDVQQRLADLRALVQGGHDDAVVGLADLPLQPPCAEAQSIIAGLRYNAAYRLALNVAVPVDQPMQLKALTAWQTAEDVAGKQGVPLSERVGALHVFEDASHRGLYRVAQAAFQLAWARHEVARTDLGRIDQYYANEVNYGEQLLAGGQSDQGAVMLATAAALADSFDLHGRGEAAVALTRLRGSAVWPAPDSADPILQYARGS